MRKAGVLLATFAVVAAVGAHAGPSAPLRAEREARALDVDGRQLVGVPVHACATANELRFRSADGTRLVGHRFGGKRPGGRTAVVLAHQSNGDLCEWAPYARRLAARGFFAFPFDLRGHGASAGRPTYGRLGLDVVGAVRAVRSLGARRVVVLGASLGGIAGVIGVASARPPVAGLVAVSAPAEVAGRLNAVPSAGRLRVPTLYLAAADDQNAPYDFAADAQRLFEATGTTEKRVEVVPGSLHGVALVAGSVRARALLETFLRDPPGTVP